MDKSEAKIGEAMVNLHHYEMPTKSIAYVGISELVRQVHSNQIITENDRCAPEV